MKNIFLVPKIAEIKNEGITDNNISNQFEEVFAIELHGVSFYAFERGISISSLESVDDKSNSFPRFKEKTI